MKSILIGIAGGTSSGKTTFTQKILARIGDADSVTVVNHDSFYRARHDLTYEERTQLNYDHPNAFDTDLMVAALTRLKNGEPAEIPVYDYTIYDRTDNVMIVQPARVILVEGILIYDDPVLRDLLDIKIFVDADADVRILRRIERDVEERGRSLGSVINQYLTTVKPMHEAFVEPSKRYADIIVPGGGENVIALDMIIHRIEGFLTE